MQKTMRSSRARPMPMYENPKQEECWEESVVRKEKMECGTLLRLPLVRGAGLPKASLRGLTRKMLLFITPLGKNLCGGQSLPPLRGPPPLTKGRLTIVHPMLLWRFSREPLCEKSSMYRAPESAVRFPVCKTRPPEGFLRAVNYYAL